MLLVQRLTHRQNRAFHAACAEHQPYLSAKPFPILAMHSPNSGGPITVACSPNPSTHFSTSSRLFSVILTTRLPFGRISQLLACMPRPRPHIVRSPRIKLYHDLMLLRPIALSYHARPDKVLANHHKGLQAVVNPTGENQAVRQSAPDRPPAASTVTPSSKRAMTHSPVNFIGQCQTWICLVARSRTACQVSWCSRSFKRGER